MAASTTRRIWLAYMAAGLVLAIGYIFIAQGAVTGLIIAFYPAIPMAAIGAAIVINRPSRRLPWLLLMLAQTCNLIGNMVLAVTLARGGHFPPVANVFWLTYYVFELTGLMLLVAGFSWRRDRAGLLDTLIVSGGLGLAVWLFLLDDLNAADLSWTVRLVTMGSPFGDLLVLAGAIRMCISTARRTPAFWQLVTALAMQSVIDFVWIWQGLHGININNLVPVFLIAAVMVGGAALHPSMTSFRPAGDRPTAQVSTRRTVLIGSACLLSPTLLIVDGMTRPGRIAWLASSLCCIAVFLLVIARILDLVRTVQDQAAQLESIAYVDALTGIPNRRAWDAELERRLAVARRSGETLVVGIIDIDHFKRYNDLLGHPEGDILLRSAAAAWRDQLRAEDLIARYGGEEFGLILQCPLRDASIVMDRLRDVTPAGQSFSAGLALFCGDESAQELTTRADAALYIAKRDGRDQYTVTGHPARTDLNTDFLTTTAR